ncbi:MAG: hypothetical protein WBP45_13935 [Daejeonella sp.]
MYVTYCTYSGDPEVEFCSDPVYVGDNCYPFCVFIPDYPLPPGGGEPVEPGDNPGNGGGEGGGEDNPSSNPPYDIENDLDNPCLKSTLDNLINNKGFNNRLKFILNDVFGKNPNLALNFDEIYTLPDSINGFYDPINTQGGGLTRLFVLINGNTLPNASVEYMTVTYLHETLHAYLSLTNETALLDHEDIATQYRGAIADALVEMYGTNPTTADALAWQGLFGTSVWSTYQSSHPNLSNQIGNTNTNHHNGVQGTDCN